MPDPTTKLPPDLKKRSDTATVSQAEANARKANAEASDAEQTAALNRVKGALGEPATGAFSGDVQLADGAALAEPNFLARAALMTVATAITKEVAKAIGERKTAYLTTSDGPPDLSHDSALASRIALVEDACRTATQLSDAALGSGERAMFAPLATAGLVVSGVSALLGYFKTDFKVGSDEVKVSDRDLLVLVGSELAAQHLSVLVDGFPPSPGKKIVDAVQTQLLDLSTEVTDLRGRVVHHAAAIASLDQAAAVAPASPAGQQGDQTGTEGQDEKQDAAADAQARAAHEHAEAACTAATTLYDTFVTSLDADAGGISFLERALRERRLREKLGDKAAVLSLKVDGSWATHIVRKNFLSGLSGKLPIRISATVGASWVAYDLDSGGLLGGGVETSKSELQDIAAIKAS
ncbi:hypothetical protein GCM10009087_30210 [Sphingomonas oligophenolica]|uniref:Uncharacterized protein n=1 Tax=Sphingomonas oligophenolica TaxID=301154 RepID=A0ABU9Y6E7_9SPHN